MPRSATASRLHLSMVMAGASHFEELQCWQLASELKRALLDVCRRPKVRVDLEFVFQARKAARSAPANIAEGFGRRTHRDFAHFLDIARGSLMESENLLVDALDSEYITTVEYAALRTPRTAHLPPQPPQRLEVLDVERIGLNHVRPIAGL